jgi:hypothetical protein
MPTPEETTVVYQPEVAQQVLAAIETPTEEVVVEPEFISNDEYVAYLELAIRDMETWIPMATRLIAQIKSGASFKGTKVSGAVRNGRAKAVISSLNDVSSAKVIG